MVAKKEKLSLDEMLEQALVKDEDKSYRVSSNWVWTKLGTVCIINPPKTNIKLQPDDLEVSFLPMSSISEVSGRVVSGHVKMLHEVKSGYTNFIEKDILFAKITPCMENGKAAIVEHLVNGLGYGSTEFHILRISKCVINKFIYYLVRAEWFREEAKGHMSGSVGQQRVAKHYLENYYLALPPLPEQQRIVDLIELLFEKLDQAKELIHNTLDSFENRKSAILHKAFTGELTAKWREENSNYELSEQYLNLIKKKKLEINKKDSFQFWSNNDLPFGWSETKIDKFIYIAGRIGWKGLKAEEYTESGPILLSVYNLNYGDYVNFGKVYHISPQRYEESPEIMLKEKDILLTKDGAGIGKLGYVNEIPAEATINSSLLLIRANNSVESKYLFYFLKGPKMQEIVKSRITGSTTPHLFQRDIKEFIIPIPPIEEQKEIVRILDGILENEKMAKEISDVTEKIDLMKKSILARAFRGELSTNNPDEESALELLKEVLRERVEG